MLCVQAALHNPGSLAFPQSERVAFPLTLRRWLQDLQASHPHSRQEQGKGKSSKLLKSPSLLIRKTTHSPLISHSPQPCHGPTSCEEARSFCWTRGCPEEKQNCIRRARKIGVLWVPTTVCHPAPQHDTLHGCLNASLWKQRGPQPRQRLNDCLAKTSRREFKQQKDP